MIGNSLAEDEDNPMADIYSFTDDGKDISLRYDLSVPLARFYRQNYLNLPNPYKRYQMGTVFRREKSSNGRWKSFEQCDCDIVGKFDIKQTNSELINVIGSTLISCGLKKSDFNECKFWDQETKGRLTKVYSNKGGQLQNFSGFWTTYL